MRQQQNARNPIVRTRGKVFTQAFSREPALIALKILLRTPGKPAPSAKVRLGRLPLSILNLNGLCARREYETR